MNPIAEELNDRIKESNTCIYEMLSEVGKSLFYPRGILTQSAEAKEKASRFNATIGMATEEGRPMYLPSVMEMINKLEPEESLTYAPSFGIMPLRKAWKREILEKNPGLEDKPISLPVVTSALTHGLSVVSDMWVDPGDVIILPDKNWGNYNMIFAVRRGAKIVQYPLFDSNWGFNLKGFKECLITEAEKNGKLSVILNFPNNPTGYTISISEGEQISEILLALASRGTNILAITDDAYFGLFYEENLLKESIFSLLAGKHPRLLAVKVDGATKENYVWGLRVGFVTYGASVEDDHETLYDALAKKTAGAVRGSVSNVSHLSQTLVLKSLESSTYKREKEDKSRILRERALEVKRVLGDRKYAGAWEPYPFNSGYFMCLRLRSVDAETLRVHLLKKYGVGLISLGERDLRIAFSCIEKEDIRELFDTILEGVKDLEP
ncbi:MAG: aminotransferase class I/II-fold pyridoxal phosphate-dependent enzyme [Deltaproteobacteria bacterium]|nr:aminotransferase class I/II-fold pyridoxal phosphate-dependent enzyme [Deltaproteobacteria bacterium]